MKPKQQKIESVFMWVSCVKSTWIVLMIRGNIVSMLQFSLETQNKCAKRTVLHRIKKGIPLRAETKNQESF